MIRRTLLALAIVAGVTAPLTAQVIGIPVVNNGAPSGISIGGDVGFSNSDYYSGGGTAFGAHASLGLGFFGVSASISHFSPKSGSSVNAPGAAGTLRLLGGPLVPFRVTMQAGLSKWTISGTDYVHVPVSIGLSATIPNPAFAIKPWIAPRVDYVGTTQDHQFRFGISGGVDISLLNGLSFRGAYDRVSYTGASPSIFSLGIGFAP